MANPLFTATRQAVIAGLDDALGAVASATAEEGVFLDLKITANYEQAADYVINTIIGAARFHAAEMSPEHAQALDEILVSMGATLPP